MAACPRLTELTVISPCPYDAQHTRTGVQLDPTGRALLAVLELVIAYKALPDFNTLQIVRFPWCVQGRSGHHGLFLEQWELALEKQTKDLEMQAIDCLKTPRTGYREGEGRRTMMRTVKIRSRCIGQSSVEVEECEVWGFDSRDPYRVR